METQLTKKDIEDKIKNEIKEYQTFVFKENMFKMAVAFVIATAFNKTINTFTDGFIMPIIKYLLGGPEASWKTLTWEPTPGLVIEVGKFMGTAVDFLIMSIILYIVYTKFIKKLMKEPQPEAESP
jgi:large conductance mechanosensitive channel protein